MNKWIALTLGIISLGCNKTINIDEHSTVFEMSKGLETATYDEGIDWWRKLEQASPYVCLQEFGETDAGLPLHLVVINPDKNFAKEKLASGENLVWLINNGIHPGEPDGIDASMLFARDLVADPEFERRYAGVSILIIPFYNVGGALNRNCCSRANQNGPVSYGFRGNAKNLDLNRDFIKCDSKNAQSFNRLFTEWNPDVYLETHVSNGADYPYTMTYLASQADKLGPELGQYVRTKLSPALFKHMKDAGDEMVPYVNLFGTPPDSGYACFYDSPRYSTGYAALHHSIGLLTETHMLKPFKKRVESTHRFMHQLMKYLVGNANDIKAIRDGSLVSSLSQTSFPVDWSLDTNKSTPLDFTGFEAFTDTSEVTGKPQLYYNAEKTWTKKIPYSDRMIPTKTIQAPKFYLVPKAWGDVTELLKANGVALTPISKDTMLDVAAYEIVDYNTVETPYEGHYLHHSTKVDKQYWNKTISPSEYWLVSTDQNAKRYIIETLEPEAPDSYFNWNFFDEILQQKEWFSPYVFDAKAKELLQDPKIKKAFDEMMEKDPTFAMSELNQLYFLYRNSDHYERERHMIYPLLRVE